MSRKQLLVIGLLLFSLSCSRKTTPTNLLGTELDSCDYVNDVVSAHSLFVGRWRLVRIKANGWGTTSDKLPAKPVEMVVSPQGQLTLYEADEATWSARLLLTQPHPEIVHYVVDVAPTVDYTTQKRRSGAVSFYFPQDGGFRICPHHLLMGDADVDGADLYWLRVKAGRPRSRGF
ncbi:hypothetical protein SAMN05216167_13327 [Spirosoma endophyticum]|uniref:Lipocalin-like domain-containing protein n=2 Tax=Spirosoma endophyticum TaxID=662367 RepID=A0A1I2GIS5_9BACT|nr:hypothetical protein SAMN05216167_13327 [Spirosoma endophyticum]